MGLSTAPRAALRTPAGAPKINHMAPLSACPGRGAQGDIFMRIGLVSGSLVCLAATAAFAEGVVDIDRSVYVERTIEGARALEPATTLRSGDKVVLVVAWRADSPDRRFTVQSAVPRTLAFQRAGHDEIEVSIDGGRNWGDLGELKAGARLASAEDVTHLRLKVAGTPAGRLTYSAIVR